MAADEADDWLTRCERSVTIELLGGAN